MCVYMDLMMGFKNVTGGRFKEIFIEQKNYKYKSRSLKNGAK